MKIAGYETHPAADLFPMMDAADLRALADDIRKHGQHNAVTLYAESGKRLVLDGRNRLAACELAGVSPTTEFWTGEGSPVSWVVSQNLHRRQLTASQRAMVAAGLVPMFEAEAKERQRATQNNDAGRAVSANLRGQDHGKAAAQAAEAVNVSPRSVESALKVVREAKPAVVEAVKRGDVAVSAAAKALRPGPPPSKRTRKDEDWDCAITLTVPHSAVPAVERLLAGHGFTGSATHNRKMKLPSLKALKGAA